MRAVGISLALLGLLSAGTAALAGPLEIDFPNKPEGTLVVDKAGLITQGDLEEINGIALQTLRETAIPIVVVTVPSLDLYGARGMDIEEYARRLFDSWGIGHRSVLLHGQAVLRNYGVLLLVAVAEHDARIELGADWNGKKDAECQKIMEDYIIALFKRGEFSQGILAGVKGLAAMVQEKSLPWPPWPWWYYGLGVGGVLLGLFTLISMIRSGSGGWAWILWGAIFSIVGLVLYSTLSRGSSFSGRSSGGYGGGSFGGGFSGGGGATGHW